MLAESVRPQVVDHIIRHGYDLEEATSTDVETVGNDATLIAYALGH